MNQFIRLTCTSSQHDELQLDPDKIESFEATTNHPNPNIPDYVRIQMDSGHAHIVTENMAEIMDLLEEWENYREHLERERRRLYSYTSPKPRQT